MTKIKIGDLFSINTPKGKAYLHYVYKDNTIGRELTRVLPGLFLKDSDNLSELVKAKELFLLFFPLCAAYKRKIVEFVGNFPIDNFKKPRYMREEEIVRGEFKGWYIIETDTWHRELVKDLTDEQRKLSDWGTWNDTLLIKRLVDGWTLEKW